MQNGDWDYLLQAMIACKRYWLKYTVVAIWHEGSTVLPTLLSVVLKLSNGYMESNNSWVMAYINRLLKNPEKWSDYLWDQQRILFT